MKRWQRRTIGILTLGGGAIGIATGVSLLLTRGNVIEWALCTFFIAVYGWGIYLGTRLMESQPGAEHDAVGFWVIQIPAFGSPFVGYSLSSGFHATVALQALPWKLNGAFFFGSTFNYSMMQAGSPWFVGVNVFALAVAWWLSRQASSPPPVAAPKPMDDAPVTVN